MPTLKFGIQINMKGNGAELVSAIGGYTGMLAHSPTKIVLGTFTGGTATITGQFNFTSETTLANSPINGLVIKASDNSLVFSITGLQGLTLGDFDNNSGLDALDQAASNLTIIGSNFDDVLAGAADNNRMVGRGGDDKIYGWKGNDNLQGWSGNDYLNGGPGNDIMRGGKGDDTYVVNTSQDNVAEFLNQGHDRVFSQVSFTLPANMEDLILKGNAMNGTGNGLDNMIVGNSQDNLLRGYAGDDVIKGIYGANRIYGNNGDDVLIGGVRNDKLFGGNGNDTLDSGNTSVGRDEMSGGPGNDDYYVHKFNEIINENPGEGTDTIFADGTSFVLPDNVENLTLVSNWNVNARGNSMDNVITGNNGDNMLNGMGGDDTIHLTIGSDTATGGPGNDIFIFADPPALGQLDKITDFVQGEDVIKIDSDSIFYDELSPGPLPAGQFITTTDTPSGGDDYLIYNETTGELFYDANGLGHTSGAGTHIVVQLVNNLDLNASDIKVL